MTDLTTWRARLVEAEAAQHELAMGGKVVELMRDGRKVRYSEARGSDLSGYIAGLIKTIADLERLETGTPLPRRRSMGVVFGG